MQAMMDDMRSFLHFGYISGDSTAGFIYRYNGQRSFFPLWTGAETPAFLPRNCVICDSTAGLLLCHYPHPYLVRCLGRRRLRVGRFGKRKFVKPFLRHYSYLVSNPFFRRYRRYIRNPPSGLQRHRANIPRVLVVNRQPTRPGFVFHVVCALPARHCSRTYSFEVYSSATGRWRTFRPHALGRIREDTGVSCGTAAYWLLHDAPLAVFYDTSNDVVGAIDLPNSYAALFGQPGVWHRSQLGKCGDKLCFVVAKDQWRAVYMALDDNGDHHMQWVCCHERLYAHRQLRMLPMLSRFQDGRLQVPFWFDTGVLALWDCRRGGLGPERIICMRGPQRDLGTDVLALVHTHCHPVFDFH